MQEDTQHSPPLHQGCCRTYQNHVCVAWIAFWHDTIAALPPLASACLGLPYRLCFKHLCPCFVNIQMSHLFCCPPQRTELILSVSHVVLTKCTLQLFLFKSDVTCMELNLSEQLWKREDLIQDAQKFSLVVLLLLRPLNAFRWRWTSFWLSLICLTGCQPGRIGPVLATVFAGAQGLWKWLCLSHFGLVLDYTWRALQCFEKQDDFPWNKLMNLQ